MDKRTLTALKGSIAKWQAIVDGTGVDRGTNNCPLCDQFYDRDPDCKGCPVRSHTKRPYCLGSPYERFFEAWNRATDYVNDCGSVHAFIIDDATERAAKAELAFLQSLLPEEA